MTTLVVPDTLQQSYDADSVTIPHILLDGAAPLTIQDPSATSGTSVIVQTLARGDGVAGGIGDGVEQRLEIANSAGVLVPAFSVMTEWSDATAGSEDSEIIFSLSIAGIFAEGLRFRAVGIDTQIVSPFAFIISPNGDQDDGLRISVVAGEVFVIPQDTTHGFFLGNSLADPSVDLNRLTARAISVVPLGTTIIVNTPAEWINFGSTITMAVPGAPAGTIGGLVSATGTFQFEIDGNGFGAGNLFKNAATFKNATGFAAHFGSQYTFVNTGVYQADGQALSVLFWRNCLFQTQWNTISAGTLAITLAVNQGGFIQPSVGTGVTFTNMRDWEWGPGTFTGTVTNRAHLYFAATNTPAATIFSGIQSLLAASANHLFIRHEGTAQANFGGPIGIGTGATVDITLERLVAGVATFGAGNSLRIPTTLFMGAAGSVNLSATTDNRLDLATGDSFRIISGSLQFIDASQQITATAGELLHTATTNRFSNDVQIDGQLIGVRRSIFIRGNTFGNGTNAPTLTSRGTTPEVAVLRFDATNQSVVSSAQFPDIVDTAQDINITLLLALDAAETNADAMDWTLDYIIGIAQSTGSGLTKTSTQLVETLTVTTGNGLAINDLYELTFILPAADANNPVTGDAVSFELTPTDLSSGILAILLVAAEIEYGALI